jgi:hypothetical protein
MKIADLERQRHPGPRGRTVAEWVRSRSGRTSSACRRSRRSEAVPFRSSADSPRLLVPLARLQGYSGVASPRKETFAHPPAYATRPSTSRPAIVHRPAFGDWVLAPCTCRTATATFPPRCDSSTASSVRGRGPRFRRQPSCAAISTCARAARRHPSCASHGDGADPRGAGVLARILDRGLVDLSRRLIPKRAPVHLVGAWRQMREKNIGWRLDYILARRRSRRSGPGAPPVAGAPRSAPSDHGAGHGCARPLRVADARAGRGRPFRLRRAQLAASLPLF